MNVNEGDAISYLGNLVSESGMNAGAVRLGETTLDEIEEKYAFIDRIGGSYSGGQVIGLVDWELGIEGVSGIELGFNAGNRLDVVVVRLTTLGFDEVLKLLSLETELAADVDSVTSRALYQAPHCQIQVETDPADGSVCVTLSSPAFQAQKKGYKYA